MWRLSCRCSAESNSCAPTAEAFQPVSRLSHARRGSTVQLRTVWTDGNNTSVNWWIHRLLSSLHILCLLLKFRRPPHPHPTLWLYKLRGQGGTNALSLVSEGCCTLFALCRNVSPPCEVCLFSFVYLLLCLKYIILLLLWPEKLLCPCSLSLSLPVQKCGNWILHLKVIFHNGITQISLSPFHHFASIHVSFILLHLDASLHLLWFTLFIWGHPFPRLTARIMSFHFALLCCPWRASVCLCVCARALVCLHAQISCLDLF